MDVDDALDSHLTANSLSLHAHRLDHNPSKLPAFRFVDLKGNPLAVSTLLNASSGLERATTISALNDFRTTTTANQGTEHEVANNSAIPISSATSTGLSSPTKISPVFPGSVTPPGSYFPLSPTQCQDPSHTNPAAASRAQEKRNKKAPASHSSNGIETSTGPPPALSTQRSFPAEPPRVPDNSTTEWALAQQKLALERLQSTPALDAKPNSRNPRLTSKSLDETASSRALIPPIRSFRSSSTRASLEMSARTSLRYEAESHADDHDRTLRALEGLSSEDTKLQSLEHDDQRHSDESTEDLFLGLAREDQNRQAANGDGNGVRRRSRIALASHRQSHPVSYQNSVGHPIPRRGSDLQCTSTISPSQDSLRGQQNRGSFQSARDSFVPLSDRPLNDFNRPRYTGPLVRSSPATPRNTVGREQLFEPRGARRLSIPESNTNIPTRPQPTRLPNLSYSTRVYNSSPLVSRPIEMDDSPETSERPRAAEGTESTASTTAPSTVWDELDDLKSRIRKLELTGKLPPTSGAAMSHMSGERPATATTTITTVSTSPKRGRGISTSPVDSHNAGLPTNEIHPLLHSALAKSKPFLGGEVYRALEATASDALVIASIIGSVGQPGPISSAQSVVGSNVSTVTDRQLRRKADSMCRSLTELCLALSDVHSRQPQQPTSQALVLAGVQDKESSRTGDGLVRTKPSPRTYSRLEARRSSLLAASSLPTPRHAQPEASTPTQVTNVAGRRTSMFLRNRRTGNEDLEDEDCFRAPSRAATEVGRLRSFPRDGASHRVPPLPDSRPIPVQSSLPIRRYISTNLNSTLPQSSAQVPGTRRYLDSSTPDRDSNSAIGKPTEERGQRVPRDSPGIAYEGIGLGRKNSLTKKSR